MGSREVWRGWADVINRPSVFFTSDILLVLGAAEFHPTQSYHKTCTSLLYTLYGGAVKMTLQCTRFVTSGCPNNSQTPSPLFKALRKKNRLLYGRTQNPLHL